jgi:hypothetical protein
MTYWRLNWGDVHSENAMLEYADCALHSQFTEHLDSSKDRLVFVDPSASAFDGPNQLRLVEIAFPHLKAPIRAGNPSVLAEIHIANDVRKCMGIMYVDRSSSSEPLCIPAAPCSMRGRSMRRYRFALTVVQQNGSGDACAYGHAAEGCVRDPVSSVLTKRVLKPLSQSQVLSIRPKTDI